MAGPEEAVLQRIESMTGEMLAFLGELIGVPTVNPPGDFYTPCAELIGGRLREFGYDVLYVAAEGCPEHTPRHPRTNVIGALHNGAERPLLHFNGHLDVVPPGAGCDRGSVLRPDCGWQDLRARDGRPESRHRRFDLRHRSHSPRRCALAWARGAKCNRR